MHLTLLVPVAWKQQLQTYPSDEVSPAQVMHRKDFEEWPCSNYNVKDSIQMQTRKLGIVPYLHACIKYNSNDYANAMEK